MISPEVLLIVAIVPSEEVQVPPGVVDEKEDVPPTQMFCPPLSVPATGAAVIVMGVVAMTALHPALAAMV